VCRPSVFPSHTHKINPNLCGTEWIAYHYFVADLRYLIVASDPRCRTKPDHILYRWRDRMTIEHWGDDRFMKKRGQTDALQNHRDRQNQFNMECLRTLKRKNRSWVFLIDTDEFVTINPKLKRRVSSGTELQGLRELKTPEIQEPGSVMTFLNSISYPFEAIGMVYPCLPMHRVQFSAKESSTEEVERGPSVWTKGDFLDYKAFQTLRWRKRDNIESYFETILGDKCGPEPTVHYHVIPGKVAIDLLRLRLKDLFNYKIKGNTHRPLESICMDHEKWRSENDTALVAHHYLGTPEQYFYRSTDSRGEEYRRNRYEKLNQKIGSSESDIMKPWLEGFLGLVGKTEASLLLKGVGEVEPIPNMTVQHTGLTSKLNDLDLNPTLVGKNYRRGHLVQVLLSQTWHWAQVTAVTEKGIPILYTAVLLNTKCFLFNFKDGAIRLGSLSDITEEKIRLKYMQQNNIKN